MSSTSESQTRSGIFSAIAAYTMWGIAPLYFNLLSDVGADEIMVHRVVWSSLFLFVIVMVLGKLHHLASLVKNKAIIAKLMLTAAILATNWFLFIWAVNNDHILDASLGYYINPLFNVALGMIFLGERLRRWQLFAVALAVSGVLIQVMLLGTIPVISLILAGTFGVYGLLRKKLHVDSFVGLLVESCLMLPIAIIYWQFFLNTTSSNMLDNSTYLNSILILAGIVTTAPLLCFTAAAKRLTLASLGFFQYIGPSLMFLLATFHFNEPLAPEKLITFALIWLALIVYSLDSIASKRRIKKATS